MAAYADAKSDCHYFASKDLEGILHSEDAAVFFRHQLLEQFHGGQPMISEFIPIESVHGTLQTAQSVRQAAWDQRMPTLQTLANAIAERHPQRAFFMYLHGGPSPNQIQSHQFASPQLQNIFSHHAWEQHVAALVSTLPAHLPDASVGTSSNQPARNTSRSKRTREQQQTQAATETDRSKRRKLIAGIIEQPGTSKWYHSAVTVSPTAYQIPLPAGAWALPDFNLGSKKLVVGRPVQVTHLALALTLCFLLHLLQQPYAHCILCAQVTHRSGVYSCTCETFRIQAGAQHQRCLHTKHVQDHLQPIDIPVPEHGVIPIFAAAFPDIKPYAYWVDDCFVTPSRLTHQLRCGHSFHKTQCVYTDAVKQFINLNAVQEDEQEGLDSDEDDNMQVLSAIAANSLC